MKDDLTNVLEIPLSFKLFQSLGAGFEYYSEEETIGPWSVLLLNKSDKRGMFLSPSRIQLTLGSVTLSCEPESTAQPGANEPELLKEKFSD